MKLFIFRHGQTEGNINNICQGVTDVHSINETGFAQAEKLRDTLAAERLSKIYSSPQKRALKTAEIVASGSNAKIEIIEDLHEINFGDAEGRSADDVFNVYKDVFEVFYNPEHKDFMRVKVPNGENKQQALERFLKSLEKIKKSNKYAKAGVATHGGLMRVVYHHFFKEDKRFDNCEYFTLEC